MEQFGCCPDNILAARGPDNEGSKIIESVIFSLKSITICFFSINN